ncbi:Urea ABC transporter, substrate binding protein UrtA [Actinokineospora spheciospongiae]|uniref:Urea ABC transporter, substrate binding protein UrtA n=1 Tax=Actinokineospora spheciospongiae TaxID=909613 RepID=W7J1V8_9PSEU|nr:urea ABC transporter substrate-binding protein [Actinokineospora spheciospongiae]EWC60069.1 Urea ABC transporter, substrate binding protein UrtA [Actinokineospora spheciospongiae]
MRTPPGRLVRVAALLSIAALGASACGSRTGDTATGPGASCVDTSGDTVKIGFLNSLSGTMAISEKTVNDSLNLAAEQINAKGGVNGKKLQIVTEDGASEPTVFAEKANKLISSDCVAAVFGGWTSSSRKAMLPVFEGANALLFYPVQYEGLESSPNIFYTGATTNQQIVPALDYLKEKGVKSLFLVGSDYVFPRTANKIINAYAEANGIEVKGEEYAPLGHTDFATIVNKVKGAGAGAVFNTLNGDSNVAFFKEYKNAGLTADAMPVVSVSIAEEEVGGVGVDNLVGQLTAWNYYQTVDSPVNKAFVEAFKAKYGTDRVTSDPMEASYTSLFLWAAMVDKAKSFAPDDVKKAAGGTAHDAPEGKVTVNGENHHIAKTALIGKVGADGLIHTEWSSPQPIEPDPFLKGYPWAAGLSS